MKNYIPDTAPRPPAELHPPITTVQGFPSKVTIKAKTEDYRQQIAAAALVALLNADPEFRSAEAIARQRQTHIGDVLAISAFLIADAMIAETDRTPESRRQRIEDWKSRAAAERKGQP